MNGQHFEQYKVTPSKISLGVIDNFRRQMLTTITTVKNKIILSIPVPLVSPKQLHTSSALSSRNNKRKQCI
jgi:hypothetical protein